MPMDDLLELLDVDPIPQISAYFRLFLFIRVQIDLLSRCSIRDFRTICDTH